MKSESPQEALQKAVQQMSKTECNTRHTEPSDIENSGKEGGSGFTPPQVGDTRLELVTPSLSS